MRETPLIVWTDRPLNAETPLELLCRAEKTPTALLFVRNHGLVQTLDPDEYRLTVRGEVSVPLVSSLAEIRERYPRVTGTATLAGAGNRRREFGGSPAAPEGCRGGRSRSAM